MAKGFGLLRRLDSVVERHACHPGERSTDKIAFLKLHFAAKLPG